MCPHMCGGACTSLRLFNHPVSSITARQRPQELFQGEGIPTMPDAIYLLPLPTWSTAMGMFGSVLATNATPDCAAMAPLGW
jgi:hypothetical protein